MIQIIAARDFGSGRPVYVYTNPVLLLPSVSRVYAKFNDVLANLPETERFNLFYTLANHSGTSGASKPQRSNATFDYQTVLAFDIDNADGDRALEYAPCAARVLGATPEALTVVRSGNGVHLIWGLKHPIRDVKYFEEAREAYKELLKKLAIEMEKAGLPGQGDPKIFDGARVLRLPGSRNVKPGKADSLCQLVQHATSVLDLDLFKISGLKARTQENISPQEIKRAYPAPDFAEMVRECEFVKWAITKPEQVHEPQAFDLFSLLAPQLPDAKAETPFGIVGPRDLGKAVFDKAVNSASLKGDQFEAKWEQAKEYGGRKCSTIHNSWIGGCESCPHWGKIPTPLALKSKAHVGSHANGYWVFNTKGQHLHPAYEDLAKVFREENEYVVTDDQRVMAFNGQFYSEMTEVAIKAWLEDKVQPSEPLREAMRMEFVRKIQARVGERGLAAKDFFDGSTQSRLNCQNGVVDFRTGKLLRHSPEYGFLYCLPYAIDMDSPGSELFLDWLAQVTQDRTELMESLLDLMAYALWPNYDDHLFAYFIGAGANGKSTLIHVLQALVGEKNYSTAGIHQLGSNRFAPAQLEGKLINLSEESSGGGHELDGESLNVIKTLSAGGTLMVERKGKDGFSFTNKAKLIFSANHAPKFKETGHAIERRMLVIPFDHKIEKPDSNIERQLIAEVPKIASMLLRRIQERVAADGRFIVCRGGMETERAKQKVLFENSAADWGKECLDSKIEHGKDAYVKVDEAYGHYKAWCESNGFTRPLSKPSFSRSLFAIVLAPPAKDQPVQREGRDVHRVYRYTKFKEGVPSYGPELRQ